MTAASAGTGQRQRTGLQGAIFAFDHWLKGPVMRWVALPVQLGLRLWVFFMLPFVNSGLTKWETFPFLKPETFAWNGWPKVSGGASYQFSNACEFCFNIRLGGSEAAPLVQWVLPFPNLMTALAGFAEVILPALILVGLLTRLSALGLLGVTVIIQLVLPWGLAIHATWAAIFLAIIVVGPGLLSLDHLLGRVLRR